MSEEFLKAAKKRVEIQNTPETEFGENDEEYDIAAENEWIWETALDKLEAVEDTAVKYLPLW